MTKSKYLVFVVSVCFCLYDPTTSQDVPAPTTSQDVSASPTSPDVPILNLMKNRLFFFGDGMYDPGNFFYFQGDEEYPTMYLPYGIALCTPTGRPCDGLMVADYIAYYAKLSTIPPPYLRPGVDISDFSEGANFACDAASITPEPPEVQTFILSKQVEGFKKLADLYVQQHGPENATALMNRSVFLFSIGTVDCLYSFLGNPNSTIELHTEFLNLAVSNLTSVLTDIHGAGGRKFAFNNAGPGGCEPWFKQVVNCPQGSCVELFNDVLKLYNTALAAGLETLKGQLQGFEYVLFDHYTTQLNRLQKPTEYGFEVSEVACCGNGTYRGQGCGVDPYEVCPSHYANVFFDGDHTGQSTNFQIAKLMWTGEENSVTPMSLEKLVQLP